MSYQLNYFNTKGNKAMTKEQFNEIVDAILDGKYSWACVLILSFAGYNPLHYIPYRTYNRLIKDNCQGGRRNKNRSYSQGKNQESTRSSKELISQK